MRNNSLSLITVLCLSTALWTTSLYAQDLPMPSMDVGMMEDQNGPVANEPTTDPALEAQKKALENELNNTDVNSAEILDFPSRASLGDLEMATLPGVNESIINGPTPMAPSVSTKDLPSEQLLGRITSEVFQEMADLERGNVFLKLQMQKEQLKNDLEKLKATYRQTRLEEIAKREDVVRSRINWWQEQENVRLEMEKKKAETEAVEQQIAEAEELRNKLRAEAIAAKEEAKKKATEKSTDETVAGDDTGATQGVEKAVAEKEVEAPTARASETYTLLAVRGVKGNLTARLKKRVDGKIITVKENEELPTGFVVDKISRDTVHMRSGDRTEVLMFNVDETNDQ